MTVATAVCLLLGVVPPAFAQSASPKVAHAVRVTNGGALHIDGALDDSGMVARAGDLGLRAKDSERGRGAERGDRGPDRLRRRRAVRRRATPAPEPNAIRTSVTRRDGDSDAEVFTVSLDTYLDRRTAYSFSISSGGVRGDFYHSQDSEDSGREAQFDPVWSARTRVDAEGWTAELRIPFSQLRFNAAPSRRGGSQLTRSDRRQERARSVGAHSRRRRGILVALRATRGHRRDSAGAAPRGDAVRRGGSDVSRERQSRESVQRQASARAPVADLKYGLGPNLTLDATINPDFGQVELDPGRRESHGVRDRVRGAAAVLHRRQRAAHGPRPELHRTAELVLQPSHRRGAARLGARRLRRHADEHDDSLRGEGHRSAGVAVSRSARSPP